ncbi:hypothetical protein ACIBM8_30810 [Micromonospora aurantiaca]
MEPQGGVDRDRGATSFYERLGWAAGTARYAPDGDVVRTYHCRLAETREG